MVGRLSLISMALGLLITPSLPAGAAEGESTITRLCLAGFHAAMAQAGETPPEGMGDFTCSCFVRELKGIAFIQQAKQRCTDLAAEKFGPLL